MQKSDSPTQLARTKNASRQRREQERLELRDLILKAAGQEFLEKGYDTFSLRHVAERIGYTPTTIYLHFRNKDDLLLATVQEGFEAFDRQMEQTAAAHADPLKRIEALGRAYIEFGLQNPALYRLMFMQRSDFYFMPRFVEDDFDLNEQSPKAETGNSKAASKKKKASTEKPVATGAVAERPRTVAMALLVTAVEEAIKSGVVKSKDPIIAADVLWAGAHGLVSLAISPLMSPEHARKVIDSLLATLISGVQLR